MIESKADLKEYLRRDYLASYLDHERPHIFGDEVMKYLIVLRKLEYWTNCGKGIIGKIFRLYYTYRHKHQNLRLHFAVYPNSCGKGLSLAHYGNILIHEDTQIGENCRLCQEVTVGGNKGSRAVATIGNNCFIGAGAKILGGITIADDVVIGANAVVVEDITEPGTTWGGIPARKISNKGSRIYLCPKLFDEQD